MHRFSLRLALRAFVLLGLAGCSAIATWTDGEVPFVPTPPHVIDRMLELARVGPGDVVYDVGSGDGAIVIRAAKKYGVRAVGIEIDPELAEKARANARREKVEDLVEFRVGDALEADLSGATVVTLYMLPEFNARLRPRLERQLKPGARVVSHDYEIQGWAADRVETVSGTFLHDHTLLLFEIGSPGESPPR
ncbi:MAG TPA: methyltransferase domain-containing protein [candidate division Zixibacteria bacterium]|nr:methyltransferase domain-containing protein [candidate division Zixibacteria bacterium]